MKFVVIHVSLTSALPWQHNDSITFLTCLCTSQYQEFFFQKLLNGACTSLSCLDYGKVRTNSKRAFLNYFEIILRVIKTVNNMQSTWITHLNQTSHWMKLKQSGFLFPPTRCPELTRYTTIIQLWAVMGSYLKVSDTRGPHGRTSNMVWPRDCTSFILFQDNMRGLCTWEIRCFKGLTENKTGFQLLKAETGTAENHS